MGWVSSLPNIVSTSLVCLALSATDTARAAIQVLSNTTLGPDPQTVNRLNGESFQQDALVTFNGTVDILLPALHEADADSRVSRVSIRRVLASGYIEHVHPTSIRLSERTLYGSIITRGMGHFYFHGL